METEGLKPEQKPSWDEIFDNLGIDVCTKLPISMLHMSDINDEKISESRKIPIQVYRSKTGDITILNGNHSYYNQLKELINKPGYKESDQDKHLVIIKKVEKNVSW